jgi:hypothetical protein
MSAAHATPGTIDQAVQLLVPRWPAEGARHVAFLALCGGLLRSGLPVAAVADVVRALAEATNDDPVENWVALAARTEREREAGRPSPAGPSWRSCWGPAAGKRLLNSNASSANRSPSTTWPRTSDCRESFSWKLAYRTCLVVGSGFLTEPCQA